MMTLCLQKNRSPEMYFFTNSEETSAPSFWATRLILVSKEAKWSALQKFRKIFKIFEFSKLYDCRKLKFSMILFLFFNVVTRKRKWYEKKKIRCFCRTNEFSSPEMIIDYVGRTVRSLVYLPRTSFFTFFVNNSFLYE